jgi:hypothetical protein
MEEAQTTAHEVEFLMSFMIGVLFSPWSRGLLYFLLFAIVLEIFYYMKEKWCPFHRVGLFFSALLGFILGRLLIGYHLPFDDPKTYR